MIKVFGITLNLRPYVQADLERYKLRRNARLKSPCYDILVKIVSYHNIIKKIPRQQCKLDGFVNRTAYGYCFDRDDSSSSS